MLKFIPLFSNLSPDQVQSIGAHAALRVYEKGEVIIRQGDPADSFFIIVAGQVRVYVTDTNDSDKEVILTTLSAGEFFGEMSMLNHEPRNASVAALERCHVQVLSHRLFMTVLERSPDISLRIMETLVRRLREADRRISTLALMDVPSRISRTLFELAILSNGRRIVGEYLTQKDLASMVGSSREMVNRTLRDLQQNGVIEMSGRSITILKDDTDHQMMD